MTYKFYTKIVYLCLILTFGASIYFYNEMKALEKIVLTNTNIEASELEAVIEEVQIYEATGQVVDVKNNQTKPLDKVLKKLFVEDNESKAKPPNFELNNTRQGPAK
ncbi:hypothetical protein DMB92_09045 [Campylobacter sp. MIT 99-7217]|uniref:hypothetical protein n=1 Tax=Campylobacter sp. MIT 99-7217 TaxID=535091 RepID=UPI00115B23D1|nr:hypothetical protein [Campylobacter sp. MIT 99-7217]TQR28706.1 hypothetical protein DMB92_09045 [Campylobacter sp. MIT 99-7217]